MFRLVAIFRELTSKKLNPHSNETVCFIPLSYKLFVCELSEDGDQPKHLVAG